MNHMVIAVLPEIAVHKEPRDRILVALPWRENRIGVTTEPPTRPQVSIRRLLPILETCRNAVAQTIAVK